MDPNFRRTVVLVGEHSEEGALGVVLNRTAEATISTQPELAAMVAGLDQVHVGGPVQPSAIVVLADFVEPDRAGSIVLGSIGFLPAEVDPDELGELRQARVFVGYAGPGTARERARGKLVDRRARHRRRRLHLQPDELWSEVLRRKGGLGVLAQMPLDPSLN